MFKKAMFVWAALCAMVYAAPLLPRIAWQVETSAPAEKRLDLKYGETIDLQCRFLSYSEAIDIIGGTVILHARTNGMEEGSSYQRAGTAAANGLATVRLPVDEWVPQGLTNVAYTIEVTQTNAVRILRATGTAWLTGTSVASSNAPVPNVCASNLFAAIVSATNALAASTSAQIGAATGALDTAVSIRITSATGAIAQATAAQIGASTGALDTAVSLRITSATGAVLQASLSALAAYSSTNNIVRFYDSVDPSIWWVANGGTNLTAWTIAYPVWTITASGTDGQDGTFQVIQPTPLLWPTDSTGTYAADGGWSVIHLPDSIYVVNAEIGGGTIGWYNNYSSGDPAGLTAYNSFISEDPVGTVTLVRSGSISTNIVGAYNLTTGNVWQVASDALLAAGQAATLINYHTAIDPAPHPGKFVGMTNGSATNLTIIGGNVSGDTLIGAQGVTNVVNGIVPSGIVTNGMGGMLLATNAAGARYVSITGDGGVWNSALKIDGNVWLSKWGASTIRFPGGGSVSEGVFYSGGGEMGFKTWLNDAARWVIRSLNGHAYIDNGSLTVAGTNTAAVLSSQGPVLLGPTIDGKRAHLLSNGTNLFFVNVNYVTNSITTN